MVPNKRNYQINIFLFSMKTAVKGTPQYQQYVFVEQLDKHKYFYGENKSHYLELYHIVLEEKKILITSYATKKNFYTQLHVSDDEDL